MQLPFADNKEFRAVLYDQINGKIDLEDINLILDKYADAISVWLKYSEQLTDGYLFGRNDEFTFRIRNEPETIGHGVAEGHIEPSHYSLYIKASTKTLKVLSDKLGKEVKNG